jgi:hypothetical protein
LRPFQIYARDVMDEHVKNNPTAKKEELFKSIGDKFFSMPAASQVWHPFLHVCLEHHSWFD